VERREPLRGATRGLDPVSTIGRVSLVQAAMRQRVAERAFEEYVREMAQRWKLPPQGDGPGAGDALPKV
jgi:hypothetical protein